MMAEQQDTAESKEVIDWASFTTSKALEKAYDDVIQRLQESCIIPQTYTQYQAHSVQNVFRPLSSSRYDDPFWCPPTVFSSNMRKAHREAPDTLSLPKPTPQELQKIKDLLLKGDIEALKTFKIGKSRASPDWKSIRTVPCIETRALNIADVFWAETAEDCIYTSFTRDSGVYKFVNQDCPPQSMLFMIQNDWLQDDELREWFTDSATDITCVKAALDIYRDYLRGYPMKAINRWATTGRCDLVDLVMQYFARADTAIDAIWGKEQKNDWVERWCAHCREKVLPLDDCIHCMNGLYAAVRIFNDRRCQNIPEWETLLRSIMTNKYLQTYPVDKRLDLLFSAGIRAQFRPIIELYFDNMPFIPTEKILSRLKNDYSGGFEFTTIWILGLSLKGKRIIYSEMIRILGHFKGDKFALLHPELVDTSDASASALCSEPYLLMQADVTKVAPKILFIYFKKVKRAEALEEACSLMVTRYPELILSNKPLCNYVWNVVPKRRAPLKIMHDFLRDRIAMPLLLGCGCSASPLSLLDQHTLTNIFKYCY